MRNHPSANVHQQSPPMSTDVHQCPSPRSSGSNPNVAQCPPMSTDVHQCPLPLANPQIEKTNPIPHRQSLTLPQRAAALSLMRGFRQRVIAHQLGLHPRTITRWKRLPDFNAEIERLHALVEKSLKISGAKNMTPSAPRPPQTHIPLQPPPDEPVRKVAGETFAEAVIRLNQQQISPFYDRDEFQRRMRDAGFEV